jgi:LysM repeat protein
MNKPGPAPVYKPFTPRRRGAKLSPRLFTIGAIVIILLGLVLIGTTLIGPGKPISNMFATDTPTPTLTSTPTITPLPSSTPTETATPTVTNTVTPSAPFQYTIQEGDNLVLIAEKFLLADDGILLILDLNPSIAESKGVIYPGQVIWIPNPDMVRATSTPIPANVAPGTRLNYTILPGDTLAGIAAKFNSIVDEIVKINKIEDPNALVAYETIIVPVNLITPTPTRPPTSTPATPGTTGTP